MTKKNSLSRRDVLKSILVGSVALQFLPVFGQEASTAPSLKGNIRHSVSKWCFKYPLDEFCKEVKKIGIESVEMVGPEKWPVIYKNGLKCAIGNFPDLSPERGLNNPLWHERLIHDYLEVIPLAAKAGVEKLICYSGNKTGLSDEQGMENCRKALSKILPLAEKNNVILAMELIGTDLPDYQCSNIEWGKALCDNLQSDSFKLLYDIPHMYSTGADVNDDIKKYHKYIAHYQIAGAPKRCEPDISKGLDCRQILQAIVSTGYKGYVAQEYWPAKELGRIERLSECIAFCDV